MTSVAFAGDWHGNTPYACAAIARAKLEGAGALIQLGDMGIWPGAAGAHYLMSVQETAERVGLPVYFIGGNHEDWDFLDALVADKGYADPIPLTGFLNYLPNGCRFSLDGVWYGVLGGAFSVDHMFRTPHVSWWPQECPTQDDVEHLGTLPLDVLLTHDGPEMLTSSWKLSPEDQGHCDYVRSLIRQAIRRTHPKMMFCVDADTEALTPSGWRRYDSLDGQPIATLNSDSGEFEWQIPQRVVVKPYCGPMIHHRGRSMDHLATPNHEMWVTLPNGRWHKRKALIVPAPGAWRYRTSASHWDGTWSLPLTLPHCLEFADPLDLAELIGWYVAEGYGKTQVRIAQDQQIKGINYERIAVLLERMGFKVDRQSTFIRVCDRTLAKWLMGECGHLAPNKRIPSWLKDAPALILERVLDAAISGDGNRRNAPRACVYYTSSPQLVDDIQEIGLKLGFATSVSRREPRGFGNTVGYCVNLTRCTSRGLGRTRSVDDYDGIVWCPTVPNGLWFMRRAGKVMVTGNCGHWHQYWEGIFDWFEEKGGAPIMNHVRVLHLDCDSNEYRYNVAIKEMTRESVLYSALAPS